MGNRKCVACDLQRRDPTCSIPRLFHDCEEHEHPRPGFVVHDHLRDPKEPEVRVLADEGELGTLRAHLGDGHYVELTVRDGRLRLRGDSFLVVYPEVSNAVAVAVRGAS